MSRKKGSESMGAAGQNPGDLPSQSASRTAGSRECDDINFTTRGGDLCISYSGVAEGEEYEITVQGKGCRSIMVCRFISGRWECSKK